MDGMTINHIVSIDHGSYDSTSSTCFSQRVLSRTRQALDRCVSWHGSAFAPVPARPMRWRALRPRCNGQWSASGLRRKPQRGWMDSEDM